MQISNPQIIELRDVLVDALLLTEMDDSVLKLGINRQRITIATSLDQIYREVIVYFNNRSRIEELLVVARAVNPTNPALFRFDQRLGRATEFPPEAADLAGLEALVRRDLPMFDARVWLERAAAVENRVCRIRTANQVGSGFLVGPDAVMTNYHVVREYIDGAADPTQIQLEFDFMMLSDGQIGRGVPFRLVQPDWLIDHSPLWPTDEIRLQPRIVEIPADHLDYALLRVAGRPGEQPVGGNAAPAGLAKPRGWLRITDQSYDFALRKALLILHHPQGRPMQLSIDTDSYRKGNVAGTRVFHRTNTEPGSSGSPCFDMDWNLVALHQGSNVLEGQLANRAAPMTAIRRLLDSRGKLAAVTG